MVVVISGSKRISREAGCQAAEASVGVVDAIGAMKFEGVCTRGSEGPWQRWQLAARVGADGGQVYQHSLLVKHGWRAMQ